MSVCAPKPKNPPTSDLQLLLFLLLALGVAEEDDDEIHLNSIQMASLEDHCALCLGIMVKVGIYIQ